MRNGGGNRFNPMLEEKDGWITGERLRQDEEMTDAVIEVMAEVTQQKAERDLNPFKGEASEI